MEDEMARRKETEMVNLRLRLPEGLRKQLDVAAEKSNRSLNSEILWRLGQTFGKEWLEFIGEIEQQERNEKEVLDRLMNNPRLKETLWTLVEEQFSDLAKQRKGR
jgi:translation initiation factor 2 alpha subunit (eIF-2alpha)